MNVKAKTLINTHRAQLHQKLNIKPSKYSNECVCVGGGGLAGVNISPVCPECARVPGEP